jgi:hypothetical protein
MRLPTRRKSQAQRLRSTVAKSMEPVAKTLEKSPIQPSRKAVKGGLLAVGGLTGLTAASAAISSRRERGEQAEDES